MNSIVKKDMDPEAVMDSCLPKNYQEWMHFCQGVAQTDMVAPCFKKSQYAVFLAIMRGKKLGLDPFTSLQNIAVINGRPQIYGDAPLALVQRSRAYEWHKEDDIKTIQKNNAATCVVKRKGAQPYTSTFDREMAETAHLWEKSGPWTLYPWRMLQLKARKYAFSSQFAAELEGFIIGEAENAEDDPYVKDVQTGQYALRPDQRGVVDANASIVSLGNVLVRIDAAQSWKELEDVAEMAKQLSSEDAAVARQKFVKRRKDFADMQPARQSKSQRLLKKVESSLGVEADGWKAEMAEAQKSAEPDEGELFK